MPLSSFGKTNSGENAGVTAFWASMDGVTTFVNALETGLAAAVSAISGLGGRMGSVESSIAALQQNFKELTDRVKTLEDDLNQGPPDAQHPHTPPLGKI